MGLIFSEKALAYHLEMNPNDLATACATVPKAVLFDAYGTLFDVYSVSAKAEELFPGHGKLLSQVWRDKQIEYTRLLTTCNDGAHYENFWSVTQKALKYAIEFIAAPARSVSVLDVFSPKNKAFAEQNLLQQYRQLQAFEECRPVLTQLRERGITTGILSNGDDAMLQAAVQSAGLGDLLDHVLSVDKIRKYKTHPEAYALGCRATSLQPTQMLFVSSNGWDALAATWYGYPTLWVNRSGQPQETLGPAPTRIGKSLRDVFDFFN